MSFDIAAGQDPTDAVKAVDLSNAGAQAATLGDNKTAITKHTEALAIRIRIFGEESVPVGISANGLGEALLQLGRLSEAEAALTKALRVRDELRLGPRFDAAVTRENVAQLCEAQSQWKDAKAMRLRGEHAGEMACGNDRCPGQMFSRSQLKACSACTSIFYCSPACQKVDWKKRHKALCTTRKTAASH